MKRFHLPILLGLSLGILMLVQPNPAEAAKRVDLNAIMAKKVPVLLEFGRGWCKPCKYMKPILDDVSKAYSGKAIVAIVNMDANKGLVRTFRIRMMPTQVFLTPDGKEFFRNEGTLEREQIAQVFTKMGLAPPGQPKAQTQAVPQPRVPSMPNQAPRKPW